MQFVLLLSGSKLARGTETDDHDNKHLMTGSKANSEFCFQETLNVRGETKLTASRGPAIKCFVIPPHSKVEKTANKSFALYAGWLINFPRFQGARLT